MELSYEEKLLAIYRLLATADPYTVDEIYEFIREQEEQIVEKNEQELINIIRSSKEPEKAILIATEIIINFLKRVDHG